MIIFPLIKGIPVSNSGACVTKLVEFYFCEFASLSAKGSLLKVMGLATYFDSRIKGLYIT